MRKFAVIRHSEDENHTQHGQVGLGKAFGVVLEKEAGNNQSLLHCTFYT